LPLSVFESIFGILFTWLLSLLLADSPQLLLLDYCHPPNGGFFVYQKPGGGGIAVYEALSQSSGQGVVL
jgi:hypothetical protein